MPENTDVKIDLRDTILAKMKSEGRSITWLHTKMGEGFSGGYNNLYACLRQKTVSLDQQKLDAVNAALGTSYTLDAE